jgi:menaquinol-cytochrome c reductase cytochrome b/c subunit
MTEIPEHLRKRAEAARQKAAGAQGADAPSDADAGDAPTGGGDAGTASQPAGTAGDDRIPEHLLQRTKASDGGGGGTAVATAPAPAAPASTSGPDGHTQRLLTVVKSGSIQDVKAKPQDKVHTWPHLLLIEFVAALAITAFLLIFSVFVNAPLLELANPNQTPNPSKAPWYFLGLQELLTMFHPMIAGVTIPTIGMLGLMMVPYIDRNPSQKPEDRKFAISLFTIFLMAAAVLTIIGSFFRGPGQNFVFPWIDGIFFDL